MKTSLRPLLNLHNGVGLCAALLTACAANIVHAEPGGRLLATGGVTQMEGSAGGGLVPWALIAGYGTRDQIGGTAFYTDVRTQGFTLGSGGVAVGFYDRVELSFARQRFGLGDTVPNTSIEQDVVGLKVKVFGDAIYDQDTPWPQIALGAQYKRNRDYDFVPKLLGAKDDSGVDYYLAATKVFLAGPFGRNWLLNGTLRASKANQFGILGFGGDLNDSYKTRFEGSAGVFLSDHWLLGVEYRQKNNNLSVFHEESAKDIFLAWMPNKWLALTAAYVDLGNIANKPSQTGTYLSLQISY